MPPKRKPNKNQISTKKPSTKPENNDDMYSDEEVIDDPRDREIMELRDKIHKLQLENAALRKNEKNSMLQPLTPIKHHRALNNTPVREKRVSTSSTKLKGCSCTGSCANKKCGCVKKDLECSEFCKCSDACQNQMTDDIDDDKENNDKQNINKVKVADNNIKNSKSKAMQNKLNSSSSSENDAKSQLNYTDKDVDNSSYSSSTSAQTDDDEDTNVTKTKLNPMKPTTQLQRSPLAKSNSSHNATANTTVFNDDDVFLPVPKIEEEDELSPPDEINQMEVDWDEHQSKLVECRKCKRKFHAYRLKKHEKSCKNI